MAIDNLSDNRVEAVTDAPPVPAQSPYADSAYTPVKPAPARSGSAAMVVAKTTGRGLGTSTRHLATGLGGTRRAAWRYLRAHDRIESINPSSPMEWGHIHDVRRKRWITAAATVGGGGVVATLGGWIGMVAGMGMTAIPGLEAGLTAESAVAAVSAALYGRALQKRAELETGPEQAAIEVGPGVVLNLDGDPFPIAQCHSADQVQACVWRALKAEGVPVAEVYDIVRQQWGWQCVVRVSEGTPEAIIKVAGDLETRFDLPTNGVRPQPMVERRACAILRLVAGDPFATAPTLPYRAPLSLSILDKTRYGTSVGGDPLAMSFAGVMGLVVAASGGGKTGVLQAIGEITTACRDNITIDIDPHGDGLEDLHDAVRLTARTTKQIEAVLLFLLMFSKGRARLRKKLGMGRKWEISAQRPHITVPFDEFPKASKLAKKLAFDLLLVGRKEAVTEILASQGGTTLYLGENIAQMIAFKAVGPCKVGDTRAVFGDGAVGEGWLPHKLSPATDTDPKDAGHLYVQGVPGMPDEPIEYKTHEIPSAVLRKLATERKEAGLVEPDQESLDAMREVDLPDYVLPEYDAEGNLKKEAPVKLLTWDQLLRLCDAEPAAGATPSLAAAALADAVDLMDRFGVDRMRTETLAAALTDHDPGSYADLTPETLRSLLAEAGAGGPVQLGAMDGLTNPRGFKRKTLADCM